MNKTKAMILVALGGVLAVALSACCAKEHKQTVKFEAPIEKAK